MESVRKCGVYCEMHGVELREVPKLCRTRAVKNAESERQWQ
jgi:hypothetical protein